MSLLRRIEDRKRSDHELERTLGIKKHDSTQDRYGGVRYSPADIEALENERLPWLKMKRRQRG